LKNEYQFTEWPTKHLRNLLPDYENTLTQLKKAYPNGHLEIQVYTKWIRGMKEELALREQKQKEKVL
jgi:hypothetical protein